MIRETELHHVMSTLLKTEHLISNATKNQVALNPTNTVFDAKRLIGCRFDNAIFQFEMQHCPFMVMNDVGRPKV